MMRFVRARAVRRLGAGFFPLLAILLVTIHLNGGVLKASDHQEAESQYCTLCWCCLDGGCPYRCGAVCGIFSCSGHGDGSHIGRCDNSM